MKKLVSVMLSVSLLLAVCSVCVSAATFAKNTYVEKINIYGSLLADNIKAISKTAFNIDVTASAKTGITLNGGITEVNNSNVDSLVQFKAGTSTLTFAKDLASYFTVSGTISGNNATVNFAEKSSNNMEVYQVTSAIDTATDTDISAKVSPEAGAKKYNLSPATVSVTISKWVTKLSSVSMGVRFFGSTYDNLVASEIAKVTATVNRKAGASTTVTTSVTDVIKDLMPGDTVTLKASLKDDAEKEYYGFYCWVDGSGNVLSTSDTVEHTVDGTDVAFYATYVELKDRFTIDYTSNGDGKVIYNEGREVFSGDAQISVLGGRDATFTFVPDAGFELASVVIDGRTDVFTNNPNALSFDGSVYSYTFKRVGCDHTIAVSFRSDQYSQCTSHVFGPWKTIVEATCTSTGSERRVCENCGFIQTQSIPKRSHQWETITYPKYVTGYSEDFSICALCGDTIHSDSSSVRVIQEGRFNGGASWHCNSDNELIITSNGRTDSYASANDVPWAELADSITNVIIGHGVKSIGSYVLESCPNLTDVTYIGFEEDWSNVTVMPHNSALQNAQMHFAHPTIRAAQVSAGNIAGRKIRVSVSLENNPGIIATLLHVNYDNSKLRLVDVRNGAFLRELEGEYGEMFYTGKDLSVTPYTSFWTAESNLELVEGISPYLGYPFNSTILTYTFEILEDAESGVTPIEITYDDASTFNSNLEYVRFDTISGSINLIDCLPGDANNDGRISLMDTAFLVRYIAGGFDVTINEINADVNRDNEINLKDVILIRRYLVGDWDVELY